MVIRYPFISPVGPMEIPNIRLNSRGSDKSLPVTGDFMLNFFIMAFMSSLDMPSN